MSKVIDSFFEDHEGDIQFFYTGRKNVIGLAYPDAVISNSRNYKYTKIGVITFDETLQSSEEFIINEIFSLVIENSIASQYVANHVSVKLLGHVTGKRVSKDRFKCVVTPEIEYMDIPDIYITEEEFRTVNNYNSFRLNIWINSSNVKKIYTTKIHSHSRNSVPLNSEYVDCRYYFDLLSNEDVVHDLDTTNILEEITRKQFASGISIYKHVDSRLSAIEAIRYPDIKFGYVNYEPSWVPNIDGSEARNYQKVPPISSDYGASLSNQFLKIQFGNVKGVSVTEKGLYLVQMISGLNTMAAIQDSDVELSLFKNTDILTTLKYRLYADNGTTRYMNPSGIGTSMMLVSLETKDILSVQFKFLSEPATGIINSGVKLQILKLIQIP